MGKGFLSGLVLFVSVSAFSADFQWMDAICYTTLRAQVPQRVFEEYRSPIQRFCGQQPFFREAVIRELAGTLSKYYHSRNRVPELYGFEHLQSLAALVELSEISQTSLFEFMDLGSESDFFLARELIKYRPDLFKKRSLWDWMGRKQNPTILPLLSSAEIAITEEGREALKTLLRVSDYQKGLDNSKEARILRDFGATEIAKVLAFNPLQARCLNVFSYFRSHPLKYSPLKELISHCSAEQVTEGGVQVLDRILSRGTARPELLKSPSIEKILGLSDLQISCLKKGFDSVMGDGMTFEFLDTFKICLNVTSPLGLQALTVLGEAGIPLKVENVQAVAKIQFERGIEVLKKFIENDRDFLNRYSPEVIERFSDPSTPMGLDTLEKLLIIRASDPRLEIGAEDLSRVLALDALQADFATAVFEYRLFPLRPKGDKRWILDLSEILNSAFHATSPFGIEAVRIVAAELIKKNKVLVQSEVVKLLSVSSEEGLQATKDLVQQYPDLVEKKWSPLTISRLVSPHKKFSPEEYPITVSPDFGPVSGDRLIVIRGQNLGQIVQVKIGNRHCDYLHAGFDRVACVVPPAEKGESYSIDVELIFDDGTHETLPEGYTYLLTEGTKEGRRPRALLPPERLGQLNLFDLADFLPEDGLPLEETLTQRLLLGPAWYGSYHLPTLVEGLLLKSPARMFLQEDAQSEQAKRDYLESPEIRAIDLDQVRIDFEGLFPKSKPLKSSDPRYMDPALLVDLSASERELLPLGRNTRESIEKAKVNIQNLIRRARLGYAGDPIYQDELNTPVDQGWILELRYSLTRILKHLMDHPFAHEDRVKAFQMFASVGAYCGPGNLEGIQLLAKMLEEKDHDLSVESQTLEAIVFRYLGKLRENDFKKTIAFKHDRHTSHTDSYYRKMASQRLQILSGVDDPHERHATQYLSEHDFYRNFLYGKKGALPKKLTRFYLDLKDAERDRWHEGYNGITVARRLIHFLGFDSQPGYSAEIKAFLSSQMSASDIIMSLADPARLDALKSLAAIIDEDCLEGDMDRLACIRKIASGFPSEDGFKASYIEAVLFEERNARFYLTTKGLREFLLRMEIFRKTDEKASASAASSEVPAARADHYERGDPSSRGSAVE